MLRHISFQNIFVLCCGPCWLHDYNIIHFTVILANEKAKMYKQTIIQLEIYICIHFSVHPKVIHLYCLASYKNKTYSDKFFCKMCENIRKC